MALDMPASGGHVSTRSLAQSEVSDVVSTLFRAADSDHSSKGLDRNRAAGRVGRGRAGEV